jgi:predicted RNA-binding Zn-ribbon protein involved in translation (DUF1610 family)
MGYVLRVSCKCRENDVRIGGGFLDSEDRTLNSVRHGYFGPEAQKLVQNDESVTIDCDPVPYICEKCGNVVARKPYDLYRPKNRKEVSLEDEDDPVLIWKCAHKCPECHSLMTKLESDEDLPEMKCPKCGENYKTEVTCFID